MFSISSSIFARIEEIQRLDSIQKSERSGRHLKNKFMDRLYDLAKSFSYIDTAYIEPQHFNYAFMIQNTNTYEMYRIVNNEKLSVDLSPEPSYKVGPYFGWRWIFLGYTIDVTHLGSNNTRKELDISLYSNQLGVDLFWRTSGDDYKIRKINMNDVDTSPVRNVEFDGFHASIKGFNLYYITNHHKFSYPAAYSQSTCQKLSAGSPLFGIGYTYHSLDMDWAKMRQTIVDYLGPVKGTQNSDLDNNSFSSTHLEYNEYSALMGYAYNWVFARNWLFNASLSASLAYLHTGGTSVLTFGGENKSKEDHLTVNGVGRFGLVWNNTRWFAGASAIIHAYNYKQKEFSTNNLFGSLNLYIGFNFGRRK